ncbi:hypothetical protein HNP47_002997 [Brevundimonas vesicularis]|uniref:Uncharacterized protein n=1 Tax=Brevundimonas vesicularis TaxID=41276 RepID=A0A7W9L710_BREVE|nr:hypothetical protein [Brevundimonas vesicularis]MBB5772977.1 hypothetical protein [Brevundimonas vesicularis]
MATVKTDAEKLADAKAEAEASRERLRAVQEAEAPILAAADEITKAIQLPYAETFVSIMAGKEAKAFREVLEAHVAASLDDIPKSAATLVAEGTKQKAERLLTTMQLSLESGQTRVASLQPLPPADPEAVPVTPSPAET